MRYGLSTAMMLVVDEDHFVARRRVGEADAAGRAMLGGAADRAERCQLGVVECEQVGEVFGRQAGDAKAHGVLHSVCAGYAAQRAAIPPDFRFLHGALRADRRRARRRHAGRLRRDDPKGPGALYVERRVLWKTSAISGATMIH